MRTGVVLALGVALTPWAAVAQTDGCTLDDYQLRTSGDLLDICALLDSHVNCWEARGFCLGFQHLDERPMETVFRAVIERWPCP